MNPTQEELSSFELACKKLWELDKNRLEPGVDYQLNLQDGKRMFDKGDVATEPLFTWVHEDVFKRPTIASFMKLFDNYTANVGVQESVTSEEIKEDFTFLNRIMETDVMKYLHKYLLLTHKTNCSKVTDFIQELHRLWFALYTRKVKNDSSGFEHVFIGEIKPDTAEIIGFHNWLRIYLEEQHQNFNYLGYILPRKRGRQADEPQDFEQLISIQFEWKGAKKMVSSSFIGTSPEFEIALYTLCFYHGDEDNLLELGPYDVKIICHKFPSNPRPGQNVYIGTIYPSVPDDNEINRKKH